MEIITVKNIGDKIVYEANGIKDWRIIGITRDAYNRMIGIHIISEHCVPTSCLNMEGYDIKPVGKYGVKSRTRKELLKWMKDYEKCNCRESKLKVKKGYKGHEIYNYWEKDNSWPYQIYDIELWQHYDDRWTIE